MNTCAFIGRLVRDPETRYAQGDQGMAIVRFTLAVDRGVKREGQPTADFINMVAFGKTGEFIAKYFSKGVRMGVTGRIQTGSYQNKEGQTVHTTDIVVDHAYFADGKQEPTATAQYSQPAPKQKPAPKQEALPEDGFVEYDDQDSDLPF
jgi:single-strand DNA-binding protein